MKKLVITGCSWAVGEWDNVPGTQQLKISHFGMKEYLQDRFKITNIAKPNGSNWSSCYAVENYLRHVVGPTDNLEIIVFQTDALRDSVASVFDVDFSSLIKDAANVYGLYQTLVGIFYIKLNSIAERHNCVIHVAGGLTDLDLEILSLYPKLVALCPSWIQLMDSEHTPSVIPLIIDPDSVKLCKGQGRLDLCDELFDMSERKFNFFEQLMESDMFGPAYGDFHPSRHGHKVIADFIAGYF